MDFDFSEKEKALFDAIRHAAAAVPSEAELAGAAPEAAARALREAAGTLAAAGYLRLGPDGAAPDDPVARMAAMETMAGRARSLFLALAMSTGMLGRALARWGHGSVPQLWRQRLGAGEWIGALALSEDTLNVENDPLTTEGVRRGGRIRLRGRKRYVINAPLADALGIVGRLEGRPAIFLVKPGTKGIAVSERMATMGYDGVHIAGLEMNDCRIDEADVLLPGKGEDLLEELRQWENEVLTAAALGLMQAAFAEARDHAKTHRTGGKPIIAYQEVGFKLSEMLTVYQTAQLLAYRAVWTLAHQPREGASLIWCAKVFATEAAEQVAGNALRILAGEGFRSGSAAESAYRAAKWTQIGGISTEIARVRIGDLALGYR